MTGVFRHLPLILLTTGLFTNMSVQSQTIKNFEKEWKKVEGFISQKLPQSALTEVKKIYTLAKKEAAGGEAQLIKSLIYIIGLQQETREDNEVMSIKEMEKELDGKSEVVRSILRSLIADMYWSFYKDIKWSRLYERTSTEKFIREDIHTWSIEDFQKKISTLYLKSIENISLLKRTKLENFNSILATYGFRFLRPSLYDLLAHRALDYFTQNEQNIHKPSYEFIINQKEAFAPIEEFIQVGFKTNDSSSLFHKALLLFQNLLQSHLKDDKKDALLDLDLKRIEFVNQHGVFENKEELYEKSLIGFTKKYPADSAAAKALAMLANIYYLRASTHNNNIPKPAYQLDLKRARDICVSTIKSYSGTEGSNLCNNLLRLIDEKRFSLQTEEVNLPGYPFRMLFSYKNMDKIHFRLIKTSREELKKLPAYNDDNNKYWNARLALTPYRLWSENLPDPKDHHTHSVELKVDSLPAGVYLIIASENAKFSTTENLLASNIIYVSNISYVSNSKGEYYVLHRNSGKPLPGAVIQAWLTTYDYKKNKYVDLTPRLYTADENGRFVLEKNNGQVRLQISYKKDTLDTDQRFWTGDQANNFSDMSVVKKGFLFTDRSIYRPGQLIYFKGIATEYDPVSKTHKILPNQKSVVILKDVNGQNSGELNVITNEMGSYKGSLRIPEGKLNGSFYLWDSLLNISQYITVEEYKRPRFQVEIKKPEGTYRLGDSVVVNGTAKAYAGNAIDGAKVKYRVVRYKHLPWWRDGYLRRYPYNTGNKEIISGELKTDLNGKFQIKFYANADGLDDKTDQPNFDFEINADVTDINGETHSGKVNILIAYQAIKLDAVIPERMHTDSLIKISISTRNMNDIFESARVHIQIHELKKPDRMFRSRLWSKPDQHIMTREQYYNWFPHDMYDNEDDETSWEKSDKIIDDSFTTRENVAYEIKNKSFRPGWYAIELQAKDKYGEPVLFNKIVRLYNDRDQLGQTPDMVVDIIKGNAEPGEEIVYQLGSPATDIFLIQDIVRMNNKRITQYETGNSGIKKYELEITEADRGGLEVNYMFVKNNRFYTGKKIFIVPWSQKNLHIRYESFRDKVTPGSSEKWKIKITGKQADKITAEVLASLYDISLDQFMYHQWRQPDIYPSFYSNFNWDSHNNFKATSTDDYRYTIEAMPEYIKIYDHFVFGEFVYDKVPEPLYKYYAWNFGLSDVGNPRLMRLPKPMMAENAMMMPGRATDDAVQNEDFDGKSYKKVDTMNNLEGDGTTDEFDKEKSNTSNLPPRRNFNETAFFLPDLRTNENGDIEFSFTIPEALTKWKFQALAHTKDLAFGYSSKEIVTQKDLMVQPNPPRFLREGDKMEFSAKIVNLTDKEITGETHLQLLDAETNEPVDGMFRSAMPNQYFTVAAGQSEVVKFPLEIPYQFNKAVVWRVMAKAGDKSDGEENALPVLTNRMLVTETIPLNMRGAGSKDFKFEKLLSSGASSTLQHHALTVEYTSNPVWYAVQALPYLMEYPYECAEQTWNRYYANALASMISGSSPRIKQIFDTWKSKDTTALFSSLQKNQELKAVMLEETPWVLQAKNEEQQKKNIALLFDLIRMNNELNSAYEKLKQMQSSNGGFVWFKGGPDNAYITQYIITGIGHLKKLGVDIKKLSPVVQSAMPYLDKEIRKQYDNLKKYKTDLKKYTPDHYELQYLYMRSFFPDIKIPAATQTAYNYFRSRAQLTWTKQSKYMQGITALFLHRSNDPKTPAAILKSLKETSLTHEELGMYWKELTNGGYYWHQAPVETQALLIEAFTEAGKDLNTVDALKTWLLKNKQTHNWKTTKATAEACYALLLQGTNWMTNEPAVEIKAGNIVFKSNDNIAEAGTGYFKKTVAGDKMKPEMGNVRVSVSGVAPSVSSSWGGVYWQYFEDLDKITTASTPLKLEKKLFVEKNSSRGPVLTPINEGDYIKVGDKIKVRIALRVDRDMEYVHMKDMRSSAMEPVNVLSSYKWQGGLGYYETTKDASTNFFFDYLRKGTYVFEYPLFVTHTGNFSNGVTTIQCMYAPEFSSHSEGVRINVE